MEKAGQLQVPDWDEWHLVADLDEVLRFQVKHMHQAAWDANIGTVRERKLTEEKYTHMRYHELWEVTPEVAHNFVLDALINKDKKLQFDPVDGARENLTRIQQLAQAAGKTVQFHVLTSRSQLLTEATTEQIDDLYPGIFEKPITLTGNITPDAPVYGKGHYYKQYGAEARASGLIVVKSFIDDSYKYVKDCVETDGGLGILFGKYAWNAADLAKLASGELEMPSNVVPLRPENVVPIRAAGDTMPLSNMAVPLLPRIVACENWDLAGRTMIDTYLPQAA